MTVVAFLDTTIYLRFKWVEHIDWCGVLGADTVRIVLPRVTMRELDTHKDHHHNKAVKDRARKILSWIKADLSPPTPGAVRWKPVRTKVTLELLLVTPAFDFALHQLEQNRNDDQLVASMMTFRAANADTEVALITADTTIMLTAEGFGIRALMLDESLREVIENDPQQQEFKKVKAENAQLKAAIPNLSIDFASPQQADAKRVVIVQAASTDAPPTDAWERAVANEERTFPVRTFGDDSGHIAPPSLLQSVRLMDSIYPMISQPPTAEEYRRYELARAAYLRDFRQHIQDRWQWLRRCQRVFEIALVVVNEGTAVATAVRVEVTLPPDLIVFPAAAIAKLRTEPPRPTQPTPPKRTRFGHPELDWSRALAPPFPRSAYYPEIFSSIALARFDPPFIDRTDYTTGRSPLVWELSRVQHGVPIELNTVAIGWPVDVQQKSCALDVMIRAGNLPKPEKSKLSVVVRAD